MEETRAKPDRTLLGILVAIVLLLVVAVVVVFSTGGPQLREPGTPERTVQDYANAVIDGDLAAAADLLSPAWKDDCEEMGYGAETGSLRLTLVSTQVRGDTATVRVSITVSYDSGPFGDGGYEHEDSFQLERSGGDWLISVVPWEIATCPGSDLS